MTYKDVMQNIAKAKEGSIKAILAEQRQIEKEKIEKNKEINK